MIDMTKPPTPRECNEVVRRAVREASRTAPGGSFRPTFVHDVASSREAARAQAIARCEQAVASSSSALASAQDSAQRTGGLLSGATSAPETCADDYQQRRKARIQRESLAKQADASARSAHSASAAAQRELAGLKSALAWIDHCTLAWLQPWLEGVGMVDPSLVDNVQLFDLSGLVGTADEDPVEGIADKHPALFGTTREQPSFEAAGAPRPALGESDDELLIPTNPLEKEAQHA